MMTVVTQPCDSDDLCSADWLGLMQQLTDDFHTDATAGGW